MNTEEHPFLFIGQEKDSPILNDVLLYHIIMASFITTDEQLQ